MVSVLDQPGCAPGSRLHGAVRGGMGWIPLSCPVKPRTCSMGSLILTAILCARYYYPDFIGKKNKTQKSRGLPRAIMSSRTGVRTHICLALNWLIFFFFRFESELQAHPLPSTAGSLNFGPADSIALCSGAVLCMLGCLPASLVSAHGCW